MLYISLESYNAFMVMAEFQYRHAWAPLETPSFDTRICGCKTNPRTWINP